MKGKPPKKIQKLRESTPKSPKQEKQSKKTFSKRVEWIFATGLALTGLMLTALQFQARPTVSLGTPLDPRDVVTTPLIVSNDGLTDLKDMRFESFFNGLEYPNRIYFGHVFGRDVLEKIDTLQPGEQQEIMPVNMFKSGNKTPVKLDFALVIFFRPAYWPFKKRRFFRFKIAQGSDGIVRFRRVAAEDIEQTYDEAVKSLGK